MRDFAVVERVANLMADAAGEVILPYFRSDLVVDNKAAGGFDPVTKADRAAEKAIREVIAEHFPEDGVLGEEYGATEGTSGYTWILDPIDGTRAFITGLPLWGTLIALHDGTAACFGLVDQPYLRERYTGTQQSAHLEIADQRQAGQGGRVRRRLSTRQCTDLKQAILMCTSPEIFSDQELPRFRAVEQGVAMSRYGGDCYAYCMLAAGHIDLVVEAGLEAYDIQALVPVVQSSGGVITNWSGDPVIAGGAVVAAGDPRVHAQALAVLNQMP